MVQKDENERATKEKQKNCNALFKFMSIRPPSVAPYCTIVINPTVRETKRQQQVHDLGALFSSTAQEEEGAKETQ